MPTDQEIAALYGEEYFTQCSETTGAHGPAAYMEMAGDSAGARRQGAQRLDRILTRALGRRGEILEVGCGPGFLLAELRQLGWSVRGLEISEFAVRHAREKQRLEVNHGTIETVAFEPRTFDAVFMGDVLEHLPRPVSSLKTIRKWMRADGVVLIAIPSTLNLLSVKLGLWVYRVRGRFKTLKIPPYHLFEYTPTSIDRTLQVSGWRAVRMRQTAVPLRKMGLRGSPVENLGKVTLQLLAHLTSRLLNRGGDRLLVTARRE
jgi:SAM-dependent methyltransferase